MLNTLVLALSVVLTVAAQLLIKKGTAALDELELSVSGLTTIVVEIFRNAYLFFGLFLLGVTFVLWIWLVSKMHLGILYSVTVSGQIALLALGTWLFFGESITFMQFMGMVVIIVGIFLLSYTG